MRTRRSLVLLAWLFGFGFALGQTNPNQVPAPASNWVSNRFREVDTLLANPGQGWMNQQRRPKSEPRFPCSVVYIRFNWADVEPEQGKYNWQVIDDVIAAWKPRGGTVAFRVMTCNAHSAGYYSSPKWLFDAGCKGFEYLSGGEDPTSGGKRIARNEPDYARQWLPGEYAVAESLQLPATLKVGEYILAVALVDPTGQRRPFQLAIDVQQDGNRYPVSRVTLD